MVKEYPFTKDWSEAIATHRKSNYYTGISYLVKTTKDICNRIKEIG
jgi:hypothetical protein